MQVRFGCLCHRILPKTQFWPFFAIDSGEKSEELLLLFGQIYFIIYKTVFMKGGVYRVCAEIDQSSAGWLRHG
jgi:hypothetical protein